MNRTKFQTKFSRNIENLYSNTEDTVNFYLYEWQLQDKWSTLDIFMIIFSDFYCRETCGLVIA